jgi:anthranilate/para-aminobenzoate synthase component II
MRYHSLIVESDSLPGELRVLARSRDDQSEIQAMRHESHPVWGVQFHPESILTQEGKGILRNFLALAGC